MGGWLSSPKGPLLRTWFPRKLLLPKVQQMPRLYPQLGNNCSKQLVESALSSNYKGHTFLSSWLFWGKFCLLRILWPFDALSYEWKAWHISNLRLHYLALSYKKRCHFDYTIWHKPCRKAFFFLKKKGLQCCILPFSYQESRLTGHHHVRWKYCVDLNRYDQCLTKVSTLSL